jgi:hypothetical protein
VRKSDDNVLLLLPFVAVIVERVAVVADETVVAVGGTDAGSKEKVVRLVQLCFGVVEVGEG